ncbi:hypothetical protein CLM62_38645 [Streptomyces sp. SA15]|nr:hypothetical protein CLM62_38645 [Streptomyces sp. SA15]
MPLSCRLRQLESMRRQLRTERERRQQLNRLRDVELRERRRHSEQQKRQQLAAQGAEDMVMDEVRDVANRIAALSRLLKPAIGRMTFVLSADGRVLPPDNHVIEQPIGWTDADRARRLYVELGREDPVVFSQALLVAALEPEGRRKVAQTAIKLGISGSLNALLTLLDRYGSREIAEDYLNCGAGPLQEAAHAWCRDHGFVVDYYRSGGKVGWGTF